MLLGQFSVMFEYRQGAQHANADDLSWQCGQCSRPDCPVSSPDTHADDTVSTTELLDQPFASSEMGDCMGADLLPELSGETWVAATYLEELMADLPSTNSEPDFIVASRCDKTLTTVRQWVQMGAPPAWLDYLQSYGAGGCSSGICPSTQRVDIMTLSWTNGHLGVSRTVYWLLERVYWPGLCQDMRSYLASCSVCLARKSPCPWRAPMGHVEVGHRWDRVAMDLLDMSVTTLKGNHYVLVIVDCFSRWTEACLLPNITALAVADAFFQLIVCRFGMPAVICSDQGREFENHLMQELCLLCGAHKTRTTPYHPTSDGLVKRFN